MSELPEGKPTWFVRDIIASALTESERDSIRHVQRVLGCPITGDLDHTTRMHIRGMQRLFNLQLTGTINEETAREIDRLVEPGTW
jgi:hypothetical protein